MLMTHIFCSIQDCGGQLTEPNGTFTSPGYPDDYPGNANCNWTIKVPQGHKILLYFTRFYLEYTSYCDDFLQIYAPSLINLNRYVYYKGR